MPPSASLGYKPGLDGLRAVAVCVVVAFHARGGLFPGGYIGVDLFFVLSGYLITTLLVQEHRDTGRLDLGRFYLRRSLRLLPALLVVCVVVALACAVFPGFRAREATLLGVLTAATYTSSVVAASGVSLGAMLPTWSLSVEEYFYVGWPVLVAVLMRRRRPGLVTGLLVMTAVAVGYRWAVAYGAHWSIQRLSYGPDTRAEQLLIGASLAVLLPRLGRAVPAVVAAVAAALALAFVFLPGSSTFDFYYYGGSTVVAVLVAVLIAHVVDRPGSPLSRFLSFEPLLWIGRRSYGIYLWNVPIVSVVALTDLGSKPQLVVKIALTFLIPAASYRWVEVPIRRWGGQRAGSDVVKAV